MKRVNSSNNKWKTIGIIVGVVLLLWLIFGGTYNSLVSKEETVNAKWADIQSTYQRRADLIPNLVDSAKEGLDFQKETLTQVTALRSDAQALKQDIQQAQTPAELEQAGAQLDNVASQTKELVGTQITLQREAYPNLDVSPITSLQDELAGTENRINVARQRYNEAVRSYNTKVRKFPTNLLAGMYGFEKKEMFEADEGASEAPDVGDAFN